MQTCTCCIARLDPLFSNIDSDNDGLTDGFEVAFDGNGSTYNPLTDLNPLSPDTDGDGFIDGVEISYNSDPLDNGSIPATGDINEDGIINSADVLLAQQIASGIRIPTTSQIVRGDVAPLENGQPLPDGQFNAGDLLVIQRKVLGLINF